MIKILFHIDTLTGGGAEKVLRTLVNHMNPNAFDITVTTIFPDKSAVFLKESVKYKSIYPKCNKLYRMFYRIEAALGLVYLLHLKADYDIECAYLETGPTKIIASSTNKKSVKLAWVHCDFSVAIKNKNEYIKKTSRWYKKYDKIICVSEQCKKSFDKMFGSGFDTVVLHNVIDNDEILSKAEKPLPKHVKKEGFTLCLVGRLTPQKNILRLLQAHKRLQDEGIETEVWIIGEGNERKKIEQYIDDNNLKTVTLFGYQSNPYPFMMASDMLVCSSSFEGYSTFITEGVVLGKKIFTTDCSGMHEILDGYPHGIICANDDEMFYQSLKNALVCWDEIHSSQGAKISMKSLVAENEDFLRICIKESVL